MSAAERAGEPEIATTTLAEIYAQQGLVDRALAMFRRLAERSPGDERLAARVRELEAEAERQRAEDAPQPESAPPPPRLATLPAAEDGAFLAWLASR